jgi:enoyl-CoA hydratase
MHDVLLRTEGTAGRITLNRPRALNALNLEMVRGMHAALTVWADDPEIHLIILDGAGDRGLCAGGDIRALYDSVQSGHPENAAQFIREEYALNLFISRYPKPYVSLMDGIVMGGGIGVSGHSSHRVVTERSVLAMPETSIGFIPDVGGTYLLSKAQGELGTHLALTSARIKAADAIVCGLADYHVASGQLPALANELIACDSKQAVEACILSHALAPEEGWMERSKDRIHSCYSHDTVEEILEALGDGPTAEALRANSPTLLKVTLRALRKGRKLADLEACLQMEYQIGLVCFAGHDFPEGVRAAIVDKDRNPKWIPSRLEDVTPELVDSHFQR